MDDANGFGWCRDNKDENDGCAQDDDIIFSYQKMVGIFGDLSDDNIWTINYTTCYIKSVIGQNR